MKARWKVGVVGGLVGLRAALLHLGSSSCPAKRTTSPVAVRAAELRPAATALAPPAPLPQVRAVGVPDNRATATRAVFATQPLDEAEIMTELRELADSSPEYSLALARQGNARFPGTPDAAERAWYICKSLVNLQDFHAARDEAKALVERYENTPWANDAARHLLVNPLDFSADPPP